jgi:hypothetical protein
MTFRPRTATVVTKPVDVSKLALDAVAGDNVRWHGKSVMVMETAMYERNGVEVRIARIWDGRRSHDVFVTELERK